MATKPVKKAAKKTAPKKPVSEKTVSEVSGNTPVRVRMYRTGLGDCFLITFDPDGKPAHMLIDCGSLGSTTTGKKLSDAVADIRKVTGDHLHLVVASHEHQDHVCGFRNVNQEFLKMKVDQVWMAWTENPEDKLAQDIAKFKGDLGQALRAAAAALTADPKDEPGMKMGLAVKSLLDFAGDALGAAGDDGAKGLATTSNEAMTFVRTGMGAKTRYLKPGTAIEDWLPNFRFYVLGPPRSLDKIQDLGEHGSPDIYGLAAGAIFQAAEPAGNPQPDESEMPFDRRFRYAEGDERISTGLAAYFRKKDAWRRVDRDWLHSAADFALQLDNLTNNTSLVLAIERISDGKVLLFPADAQEGNWLSWHDAETKFTVRDGTRKTAEDLLNATVFYKVGHHGSHNATASRKGLELMTSHDELVAFIPVDRRVALGRNPKGSWRMPAPALYPQLLEKCQGRVVRADLGWADDAKNAADKVTEAELVNAATAAKWPAWRANQKKAEADARVRIEDLFIDYRLS